MLSNVTYHNIKWIAQYFLPGIGTLCFIISSIWGLPYGEQILGTITALDLFLGWVLGISSRAHNGDGVMIVDTSDPERDVYRLELDISLEELRSKDSITFKVVKGQLGD